MDKKQPRFCHLCREKLSGKYLVYDNGLVVCERCNRTTPHCSMCDIPSHQLTKARSQLICAACRQKAPICAICEEPILDRYFTYQTDNKSLIVCDQCRQSTPQCSRCHLPSRQLTQIREGSICPACREQAPVCKFCSEPILHRYIKYGRNLIVCEDCDRTVPHCSTCKVPSRQLTKVQGGSICPACRKKALKCACCNEIFLGTYYTIDDSPVRYCETCINTRPRCDICHAPFIQGKILPGRDGDIRRCAACFSSAVTTREEAERLYRETLALLKRELALEMAVLPKLHVIDRATLVEKRRQANTSAYPITSTRDTTRLEPEPQHLLGFFRRINDDWNIYIEHFLPRIRFQAVAAHELAHAWQSTHAPETQPPRIVEGFAEWIAYKILLALGEQHEAERLTQRSDLYGEGLQYFIALEQQQGRKGVLQRARRR